MRIRSNKEPRFLLLILGSIIFAATACGQSTKDYFPNSSGKALDYQFSMTTPVGGEQTAEFTNTNMPNRQLNGVTVIPQRTDMNGHTLFEFYRVDETGVYVIAQQDAGDLEPKPLTPVEYLFKTPLRVSATWSDPQALASNTRYAMNITGTCTIKSLDDTQTVPAGTYNHLLEVWCAGNDRGTTHERIPLHLSGTYTIVSWYEPGLGLVKEVRNEQVTQLGSGSGLWAIPTHVVNSIKQDVELKAIK